MWATTWAPLGESVHLGLGFSSFEAKALGSVAKASASPNSFARGCYLFVNRHFAAVVRPGNRWFASVVLVEGPRDMSPTTKLCWMFLVEWRSSSSPTSWRWYMEKLVAVEMAVPSLADVTGFPHGVDRDGGLGEEEGWAWHRDGVARAADLVVDPVATARSEARANEDNAVDWGFR